MPHAMAVTIQYEGGGETELGIVPAGGEQTFTLAASPGENVTLVASDEEDTHSRETTVTLSTSRRPGRSSNAAAQRACEGPPTSPAISASANGRFRYRSAASREPAASDRVRTFR